MSLRAFYSTVVLLGFVSEICLFAILVLRRQYRTFNLLSGIVVGLAISLYSTHAGDFLQLASMTLMYLLELCVLFEIAWNVLRPVHMSLPRGAVRVFLGLLSAALLFGTLLAWQVHDTGNKIDDIKRPL